jgi:hypothetical protein
VQHPLPPASAQHSAADREQHAVMALHQFGQRRPVAAACPYHEIGISVYGWSPVHRVVADWSPRVTRRVMRCALCVMRYALCGVRCAGRRVTAPPWGRRSASRARPTSTSELMAHSSFTISMVPGSIAYPRRTLISSMRGFATSLPV